MIIKFISFLLLSLLQLFSSTVTLSPTLLYYYCCMCVQTYIKLAESIGFTHMYMGLGLITSDCLTCQGP